MRSIRQDFLSTMIGAGLLVFLVAPASAQQPTDAQDLQIIAGMLPAKKQLDELTQAGRYKEAEALARQMLDQAERSLPHRPELIVLFMNNLAVIYTHQGRWREAEAIQVDVVARLERAFGADAPAVAVARRNLASVRLATGRFAEAEADLKRVLERHQRQPIFDDAGLSTLWNELGSVHFAQGRFAEAEAEHRQSVALVERARGPDDPELATSLNNLAQDLENRQRYSEAEALYRRALEIHRKRYGPEDPNVANYLANTARVVGFQGRNPEAESLQKQALAITERTVGADNPAVTGMLNNLAAFYLGQGREPEAEPILVRMVAIYEKAGGPDHPALADPLTILAFLRIKAGRRAGADRLLGRALAIREKTWGPGHPQIVLALVAQAAIHLTEAVGFNQRLTPVWAALNLRDALIRPGRSDLVRPLIEFAIVARVAWYFGQSEAIFRRALAVVERAWGIDHPQSAWLVSLLSMHAFYLGRVGEAIRLADRSIALKERGGLTPGFVVQDYQWRSRILWAKGRRGDALADLRHAMDLAERERSRGAGGDFDQARFFSQYANVFDQMVAFQSQAGDAAAALSAAERGRARALLDQIELQGTDLLVGVPEDQAAPLRQQRGRVQTRIADLNARLSTLERSPGPFGPEKRQDADALRAELNQARTQLIEVDREVHNLSQAARLAQSTDRKPVSLDHLRATLARSGMLLLEYVMDEFGGYVLVVPGTGAPARVEPLMVSATATWRLGGFPAPLNEARLQDILIGSQGDGVLPRLSRREGSSEPDLRLAALWEALIPEPERRDLLGGRYRNLVIVPDAALALLPFEALMVDDGREPKYLLDAGPPITYVPSATLLQNLIGRPAAAKTVDRDPVLAIGDPAYGAVGAADPAPTSTLAMRSRYSGVGGRLTRLPNSGVEARWVSRVYGDRGIKAGMLSGTSATERGVRFWAPGRRVLHVACHGRADEQFGNFFGALALTPGPAAAVDPADDGFLTLPEIYELNLKSCELAILSACQTNYGPQQKGEGVWALSRGFLVAGSRRVVASNWLVDDEAAASLVSYFAPAWRRTRRPASRSITRRRFRRPSGGRASRTNGRARTTGLQWS